jgi:hypothetical protein
MTIKVFRTRLIKRETKVIDTNDYFEFADYREDLEGEASQNTNLINELRFEMTEIEPNPIHYFSYFLKQTRDVIYSDTFDKILRKNRD